MKEKIEKSLNKYGRVFITFEGYRGNVMITKNDEITEHYISRVKDGEELCIPINRILYFEAM